MATPKPKKSTASNKKIIDIKHVGDAASGTSRPVIITNRPVMKDPMMAEASELAADAEQPKPVAAEASSDIDEVSADATESEAPPPIVPKKKLVIQPLSDDDKAAASDAASTEPDDTVAADDQPAAADSTAESATDEVAIDAAADEQASEPAPEPEDKDEAEPAVKPGRSFEHNELSDDAADADGSSAESPDEAKAESKPTGGVLTPEQQKAVEAGTYFLPITTTETRRLRRDIIATLILLVLLALIWVDVMLDAGTLHINGIHAITNFF